MPELPELEIVREVLQRRIRGSVIADVKVLPPGGPIVTRDMTHRGLPTALLGAAVLAMHLSWLGVLGWSLQCLVEFGLYLPAQLEASLPCSCTAYSMLLCGEQNPAFYHGSSLH